MYEKSDGKISILIGHYNAMSCELINRALQRRARFNVVAHAFRSDEVLAAVRSFRPHVALITANLKDGALGGFVVLRRLREAWPELHCVMLLDSPEPQLVVDAFRVGAKVSFVHRRAIFTCSADASARCIQVRSGQTARNSGT